MPKQRLFTIEENEDEEFMGRVWEDFDHSQKVMLGFKGFTWTVRDKSTSERYILQSCYTSEWNKARYHLIQLSRQRQDLFVAPKYLFFRGSQVYVCSEAAGTALAEVIDATLSITEVHAAAIIKQVIKALQILAANNIFYKIKASNVFVSKNSSDRDNVSVRLAGFGPRLQPELIMGGTEKLHCQSIGQLVYHMLTRMPDMREEPLDASEQILIIRTESVNIPISIDHQFSSRFFDFIETCMNSSCTLEILLHHFFLRERTLAQLGPLLHHTRNSSLTGSQWRDFCSEDDVNECCGVNGVVKDSG